MVVARHDHIQGMVGPADVMAWGSAGSMLRVRAPHDLWSALAKFGPVVDDGETIFMDCPNHYKTSLDLFELLRVWPDPDLAMKQPGPL